MKPIKNLKLAERFDLEAFIKNTKRRNIETRRAQAILLLCSGTSENLMTSLTGFNKKYTFKLRRKYQEKGITGLELKKRKSKALLTKGQIQEVTKILKTRIPQDFGIHSNHWTTAIVGQLIEEQYAVTYKSRTSLYVIFKKAKFSYHKPGLQYKNRDQGKIDTWNNDIKNKLNRFNFEKEAVLLVEDEMMLTTQTTCQKLWLPRGTYPLIEVASKRERRCIYGFLNVLQGTEHAFKTEGANSESTIQCLENMGNLYSKKQIVIVWDNASWHRSKLLKTFLTKTAHDFLPHKLPGLCARGKSSRTRMESRSSSS